MTMLTAGLILRRQTVGDYDCQYVIYTKDLGKISATAKSAKKIKSKLGMHLDYFRLINLMIAKGVVINRLAGATTEKCFSGITSDLDKIAIGYYFLEIMDKLVALDYPDSETYSLAVEFFSRLDEADDKKSSQLILNESLYKLFSHLGYQPKIKAKSQRQLTHDLNRLAMEVSEREIKSFSCLNG